MANNHSGNGECSEATPVWLTKSYLENVLKKYLSNDNIHVTNFIARTAVPKGGNYVGQLLRCTVHYVDDGIRKHRSVVIKTALSNESAAEKVKGFGVHAKEMALYTNVLPKYKKLLCGHNVNDQLYPVVLHIDPDTQTMVMEDLQEEGFEMADRLKGLDINHLKVTINKLAKHHACSMVLERQGNVSFKGFYSGQIAKKDGAWNEWYETLANAMIDEIQTWKGYEYYADKLNKIRPLFIEQAADIFEDTDTFPLALNHGDLWMNNIMFRYNEKGVPVDAVMMDFSEGVHGAVCLDFIYLFMSSATEEIKLSKFNELFKFYHQELTNALTSLQYNGPIPTLHQLYVQLAEKMFYEVVAAFGIMPVTVNVHDEHADLDTLTGSGPESIAFRKQLMSNPAVQNVIKYFLPLWDQKGLLEPLKPQ